MTLLNPTITKEAFDAYCQGPFRAMLDLLSLPMKSSSLRFKQAAARALGFSAYESLVAQWQRQHHIQQGIHCEWCPTRNALTLKAANILAQYHPDISTWFVTALRPGEEARPLGTQNAESLECAVLECPQGAVFNIKGCLDQCRQQSKEGSEHAGFVRVNLPFTYLDGGQEQHGYLSVFRSDEGLILDVYDNLKDDESVDSVGMMFTDRAEFEDEHLQVNLVSGSPSVSGMTFYRWMKPRENDSDPALVYIDPDEEFDISTMRFDSAEDAVMAIQSEEFNMDPQSMSDRGAVLVKWTATIASSPY